MKKIVSVIPKMEKRKKKSRVRDNREYNRALENRGDLTIYISEEVIEEWKAVVPKKRRTTYLQQLSDKDDVYDEQGLSIWIETNPRFCEVTVQDHENRFTVTGHIPYHSKDQ